MSNQITYAPFGSALGVWLNKKRVGVIKKVEGGYAYFPKGEKDHGEIMPTIQSVKESLETA